MSVLVDWARTVEDNFVRLQYKLLGRGRLLLINWVAHMASSFISSFSAQGALQAILFDCDRYEPHSQ